MLSLHGAAPPGLLGSVLLLQAGSDPVDQQRSCPLPSRMVAGGSEHMACPLCHHHLGRPAHDSAQKLTDWRVLAWLYMPTPLHIKCTIQQSSCLHTILLHFLYENQVPSTQWVSKLQTRRRMKWLSERSTCGLTVRWRGAFLLPRTFGGAEGACGGAGVDTPEAGSRAGTYMRTNRMRRIGAPPGYYTPRTAGLPRRQPNVREI